MKRALTSVLLALTSAVALAGSSDLVLDINVFQGYRASAPAGEPFSSPVVVMPPEPGWSGEIEKQRQQIAETLGLDGATIIGRVRAILPPGSGRSVEFPREGSAPLIVEVSSTRAGGSRVSLDVRLREKGDPQTELASISVSGEVGKTFIVGGKPASGPVLVSVTPRESSEGGQTGNGREIHKVGGDVKPPVLLRRVDARYPEKLKAEKKEGVVVLQVSVDDQGRVVTPAIVRHSDPEFDAAALEAVRQWEYSPATLQGKPVAVYLTITVSFRLK
jgi:TonB family protein